MSELVESFARICSHRPSRPLVHLPAQARTWTADELWQRFEQMRDRLASAGIGRGDLVVARIADAPTAVTLLAATLARGAVLAPCDRSTPSPELLRLADRFGARATIIDDESLDPTLAELPHIALPGAHHVRLHQPSPDAPARGADIVVLKLTSGSTGEPRAVAVTEAQLIADSRRLMRAMRIGPDDVQVASIPLSHAYGHGNLVVPVLLQGTAIVRRESFVPLKLVEDAAAYGATAFPGVPFMFDHLAGHLPDGAWPPMLGNLMSAGAPLSMSTVRAFHARFGVKVHSFYGASESGGISYDDGDEIGEQMTQGRPLPGVTVTLKADTADDAGSGRVHVASDAVGCGYLGESASELADGAFLTGDIGRFDEVGRLCLLGRVSSFVNVAGRKVQPEEVEQVLRGMPGVADARVVGAADPRRGEQLVACVVPTGPGLSVIDLRRYCAERLAPHKIPHVWILVDAIPLTERGKTDRRQLQSMVSEHLARV
jgi:long-chain acyl-CoA synthetase